MGLYNHILLATDLQPDCKEIALKAREIANQYEAKLSVVHVLESMPIYMYSYMETSQLENEVKTEAANHLQALCESVDVAADNQYVEIGGTTNAVLSLANKIDVDLIIVGSHSHKGLAKLLGSTANSVLHGAKCDVLTLRFKD